MLIICSTRYGLKAWPFLVSVGITWFIVFLICMFLLPAYREEQRLRTAYTRIVPGMTVEQVECLLGRGEEMRATNLPRYSSAPEPRRSVVKGKEFIQWRD